MNKKPDCIFCMIVRKEIPSYMVWESDTHTAFLTRWPNTEGFTVVIPKAHYDSYIFAQEKAVIDDLMDACKVVAGKIDRAFDDVGRTGLIFEGFGVNHLHAKLVPLHGTADDSWRQRKATVDTYFPTYPGYISSNDSKETDAGELSRIAEKIRNS
jgi:diadenosine tetraphosphate (Ap4A) HIT family hydrolase